MPAFLTHYTLAQEIVASESYGPFVSAFLLGAQGPDPFFFYAQLKRRENTKKIRNFGSYLHHTDFVPVYNAMLKIASGSSLDKELFSAYIEGLFCHYALDRSCHPYIFYKSGWASDPTYKKAFEASHACLETYIDIVLTKKKGTYRRDIWRVLDIPDDDLDKISLLWSKANALTTKKDYIGSGTFATAVRDFQKTVHFLNTFKPFKRFIAGLVIGKDSNGFAMIYPNRFPKDRESIDYLNLEKKKWKRPFGGKIEDKSFLELFEEAKRNFYAVKPILWRAEEGEDVFSELEKYVGLIDHDGKPIGKKMTHYDSIWPSYYGIPSEKMKF
ncbi:MAG: zinc dependent phospholipase C family protein [Bacilli bacterium]|nr:zinc dependent phospholipase C family protein [Bacilli bacterium]